MNFLNYFSAIKLICLWGDQILNNRVSMVSVILTFWSPNLICLRAFLETFIRQRKSRLSSPWVGALRTSSVWMAWWSCLSIMSYTLSPCISKSSWKHKWHYTPVTRPHTTIGYLTTVLATLQRPTVSQMLSEEDLSLKLLVHEYTSGVLAGQYQFRFPKLGTSKLYCLKLG